MRIAVFIALGLLLYVFLVIWLMTHLRYHISRRDVKITLFGITLRRIPFSRIDSVTKRRSTGLAENWSNTLSPSHRMLIIRLCRGLRPNIIITPRNRYVFKANLEKALARGTAASSEIPTEALDSENPDSPLPDNAEQRSNP